MLPASPLHTPFLGRAVSVTPRCILTFNNNLWCQSFHMPVWSLYFPDPEDVSMAVPSARPRSSPSQPFCLWPFPWWEAGFPHPCYSKCALWATASAPAGKAGAQPSPLLGTDCNVRLTSPRWLVCTVQLENPCLCAHSRGDSEADTGEGRQQSTIATDTASQEFNCG